MKVLVIEDDADIVEFISIAFDMYSPAIEMISTHLGYSGLKLVESASPNIVLLDIGLPDIDGLDALKQIRAFSEVPVIIESVQGDETVVAKGLSWGADNYIVKPFGQLELLARVKAVTRRAKYGDISNNIRLGIVILNTDLRQLSRPGKTVNLTRTESLIMHTLMSHHDNLVTYPKLAEVIWGDDYLNSSNAIRVYIRRIRAKLAPIVGGTWSIDSHPGVGYVLKISN